MLKPIRVLVVDDSALMRSLICSMLSSDRWIKVIDIARDGEEAVEKALKERPDVITLDVEMPCLNGLKALQIIMKEAPTRVIMLSGINEPEITYEALSQGAVDFVVKPSGTFSIDIGELKDELILKVKIAAGVRLATLKSPSVRRPPKKKSLRILSVTTRAVAIGASTGGPRALERIFADLPADLPAPIMVVQHLPIGFSHAFAERLASVGRLPVKEAENGDILEAGMVFVAPAGRHMLITKNGRKSCIKLEDGPRVWGVKPSADKLMQSVAEVFGSNSIGVVLTGMGVDGAAGVKAIKEKKGTVIVQDEKTSVVFGMAKAAIQKKAVDKVVPVNRIGREIIKAIQSELSKDTLKVT
jgi:two-component system chemotaxis response regulator CheB